MDGDIRKLGKYDILGELGKGAMGVVYKGFDPGVERPVAIKTIRLDLVLAEADAQEQLARFKREAQAAGRLNHPNIVTIYEYGEDAGRAFIAMEYIEGRSLKEYFDQAERFDIPTMVGMMGAILSALDYSHRNGIVHRDIKPANIMLTKAREVKITDFGIARLESSSLTQAGSVLGTPAYMSPEQFMGQQVDARSDIFSAGAVLYQMLTGEKPFTGALTTIMHRVLNTEADPPSVLNVQVPPAFDAVVAKAMAKRPEQRFQSAQEFAQALRKALDAARPGPAAAPDDAGDDEATVVEKKVVAKKAPADKPVKPVVPPPEPPRSGSGRGLMVGGGLAVILAAAAGGWWFMDGPVPAPVPLPSRPPVEPVKPAEPPRPPEPVTVEEPPKPPEPVRIEEPPKPPEPPPLRLEAIQAALNRVDCSALKASVDPDGLLRVSGSVPGAEDEAGVRRMIEATAPGRRYAINVNTVARPICAPLTLIDDARARNADLPKRLTIRPLRPEALFKDGERLVVEIDGLATESHLRVDYFQLDGTVTHLLPNKLETSGSLAAASTRKLGDSGSGGRIWTIGPPFGTELLIAIATPQPLSAGAPRPESEPASAYLTDLKAALDAAGSEWAASTLLITTQAKTP